MEWPAQKITKRKVSSLKPYDRNARTHSDEQVDQIAASIQEWGFTTPILIDEDGGIIAGHGRLLAAKKLGLKMVPTITARGWTDAQKRAYIIADNKLALNAGWDEDLLRLELRDLCDINFDVELTGFYADELSSVWFDSDSEVEMPDLPDGDRAPFQQMTFTLHDTQAEQVLTALKKAKDMGGFGDAVNENSNGNALARICEVFNGIS